MKTSSLHSIQYGNPADFVDDFVAENLTKLLHNYNTTDWLYERAILVPKNVAVNNFNYMLLNKLLGVAFTYNSIDCVVDDQDSDKYPVEHLNSLQPPSTVPRCIQLQKKGTPVMLFVSSKIMKWHDTNCAQTYEEQH